MGSTRQLHIRDAAETIISPPIGTIKVIMNGRVIKEVGIKQARLIVTLVIIDLVGQGLKYELGDKVAHHPPICKVEIILGIQDNKEDLKKYNKRKQKTDK